mgnify:CR=1 FL=1
MNNFDLLYINDKDGVRKRLETEPVNLESSSTVAFEFDSGITIKWNGSATFNVYSDGKEVDVFTHYGIKTADAAKESAEGWHKINVENYNP